MVRLILLVVSFNTLGQGAYGLAAQTSNAPMASASPAAPSAASTAQPLDDPFLASCEAVPVLKYLTTSYNKGDWEAFQADGRTLLDALRKNPAPPSEPTTPANRQPAKPTTPADCNKGGLSKELEEALDYTRRYVVLTWVGTSPLGKTQVMRAVVHSATLEPYSADLPGVAGFTEVFLASSLDARAISLYTSTREKDPFSEQLPDFVKAIFTPLSTTIAGILGAAQGAGKEGVAIYNLAVTVSGVVLPIPRASVRLQARVKELATQDDFRDAVATLGTTLLFDGAGRSERAHTQGYSAHDPAPSSGEGKLRTTRTAFLVLTRKLAEPQSGVPRRSGQGH
jgi:hypothetical protein